MTDTVESIMARVDECINLAADRHTTKAHEKRRAALRAAVERVIRDRDEWKSAAEAATVLASHNYDRAERAEDELRVGLPQGFRR